MPDAEVDKKREQEWQPKTAEEEEPEQTIFSDEILSIPTMDYKSTAPEARTRP